MVDLNKVSGWAKENVEKFKKEVAGMEGNLEIVDTAKEKLELSRKIQDLISGTSLSTEDTEYLMGYTIEYTTTNTSREQVPQKSVTDDTTSKKMENSTIKNTDQMSATELKEIQEAADYTADNIQGPTLESSQYVILNELKKVNSENILEFLTQYEKTVPQTFWDKVSAVTLEMLTGLIGGSTIGTEIAPGPGTLVGALVGSGIGATSGIIKQPDSFFEQLVSEWSFPEKQELLHKLTNDLKDFIVNKYGEKDSRALQLQLILNTDEIAESQAEEIDEIVKTLFDKEIKYNKA